MSIIVTPDTRVLVQGITGREGALHTTRMRVAGTNVVAGVSPGKGGQSLDGVRVFDAKTVQRARTESSYLEVDLTLGLPVRYGLGLMLAGNHFKFGPPPFSQFGGTPP